MRAPEPPRGPRWIAPPLAALALRRAARPAALVAAIGIAVVLGVGAGSPAVLDGLECDIQGRGLARQAAWTGLLVFLVPALALHAGGTFERWRHGEADWLGARPVARRAVVLSTWLGLTLGTAVLVAAGALAVELAVGGGTRDGLALAWARSLDDPPRIDPGGALEVELDPPPARSALLRAHVRATVGGAPATDARVVVQRGDARLEDPPVRVSGRTWIERAVPPGEGPVTWTLHNDGEGALALVGEDAFTFWRQVRWEGRASAALGLRAVGLGAAAGALALALGAWLSPFVAGGLALVLALGSVVGGHGHLLAGADVVGALDHAGLGRVPAAIPWRAWVGTLAVAGGSLALARLGTRSWRGGA